MVQPVDLSVNSETESVIVTPPARRTFQVTEIMESHVPFLHMEDGRSLDSAIVTRQDQGNPCLFRELVEFAAVWIIIKEVFYWIDHDESSAGFQYTLTQQPDARIACGICYAVDGSPGFEQVALGLFRVVKITTVQAGHLIRKGVVAWQWSAIRCPRDKIKDQTSLPRARDAFYYRDSTEGNIRIPEIGHC